MLNKFKVLAFVGSVMCSLFGVQGAFAQEANPAVIEFFAASKTALERVEPVTLTWQVRDAVAVDLFDGYHNRTFSGFQAQDTIKVWTDRSATYTLIARGLDGRTVTRQILISFSVPQFDPQVDYFYPSSAYLLVGQSTTLQWRSRHGSRVAIVDLQAGTKYDYQPASGSLAVSPTQSTTYQITVTSDNGRQVQAQTQIQVTQVPPTQPAPQPYPLPSTYPGGGTIPVPYPFPYPYTPGSYNGGYDVYGGYGGYGAYGSGNGGIYQPLPYPSRMNGSVIYPGGYGHSHHRVWRRPR